MIPASDASSDGQIDRRTRPLLDWRRPPRWIFHAALVAPALGLLWSYSVPGVDFFLWLASTAVLALAALVWVARLILFFLATGRRSGDGRWLLIAPLCGIVIGGLIRVDAPLRTRWAVSRSAFEDTAREATGAPTRARLGWYTVASVRRQGDAVIFYEETGSLVDDAGFAYLPDGPLPDLERYFESPEFRNLGGPWYAWTANSDD